MYDVTSLLFAARELCESLKSENKNEENVNNEEYSSCLIGKDTFYFPKKKEFSEKEDLVPNLF